MEVMSTYATAIGLSHLHLFPRFQAADCFPIAEIRITVSAQPSDIALWKIASDVPPPSFTAPTSVAANVIASSTNHPISPDRATDCQTPFAARTATSRA